MGMRGALGVTVMLMAAALLCSAGPSGAGTAEITLRAGHDQPLKSMYDEGHTFFARQIAERTGGRIQAQVFPAAQLGAEPVMIDGIRMGSIDLAVANAANFATVVPDLGLFSVSYLFKDKGHLERTIDDPKFQQRVSQIVASKNLGLIVVGYYTAGIRSLYNRKVPVMQPADLKGMKIRVMANPIEAKMWSTFGGIPTPMATGEVYTALQAGTIDGGENSPSVIESFKYNEPAPHLALTEHQYSISPLIMSEKRFNSMNPELQKVFMDVVREACQYERKRDTELVAESLERMKAKGTKITQPDKAKFAALAAPIQEEVAKSLKVEDLLALVRSHAK